MPRLRGKQRSGADAESRERFGAGEGAFAPPFVILAQLGLVFFDLSFEIAEGFLATGPHARADAGGMQRSARQR